MTEYALGILAFAAFCGALSLLCFREGVSERIAIGIISLFVIISPVLRAAGDFDPEDLLNSIKVPETEAEGELSALLEDAFAEGIGLAVCEKFGLNTEWVSVRCEGFDYEKMTAERIRITLSGRGALESPSAIEKYVKKMNIGECDVEIKIG